MECVWGDDVEEFGKNEILVSLLERRLLIFFLGYKGYYCRGKESKIRSFKSKVIWEKLWLRKVIIIVD